MTRFVAVAVLLASSALAQRGSGELRLGVTDPAGLGVEAEGLLAAPALHFQVPFRTDAAGNATVRNLPFGSYRLSLSRPGFATGSAMSISRLRYRSASSSRCGWLRSAPKSSWRMPIL